MNIQIYLKLRIMSRQADFMSFLEFFVKIFFLSNQHFFDTLNNSYYANMRINANMANCKLVMKKELPKAYEPSLYEDGIYKKWEESGLFNPDNLKLPKNAPSYSIIMPPPNVTGTLHMGHAVMLAIEDILTRYHRMKGERALWVPGTDHAAIATQTKVEKDLKKEGLDRHKLGREKFLDRVNRFAKESHDTIVNQIKKMGSSCDWSREAYTLDEIRTRAVRTAFKMMYDDGLIYRGERIVNWCPRCHSTLADDEVEYRAQKAKLYTFKYDKNFPIAISTTRPETKLGDTAVAVNPKDERYKKYVGKTYEVNFVGAPLKIKIIADKEVDMNFGTGAVGVTPAHSMADWQMAEKYGLEKIKVIDEKGDIRAGFGEYSGKNVFAARKIIVEKLRKNNLIAKEEEIDNNLSLCYRCDTPIEPLPSLQWFIDVNKKITRYKKSLKELSIEAVKKGVFDREKIKIIPERFEKNYFHWMDNLRDWCISRQIWFGHRIPVWYCGELARTIKKMGFAGDIVAQVFDTKTRTYRLRDHGIKVGDVVAFEDSAKKVIFGYGKITKVAITTVGQIDLDDKKHWKTYEKREDLIAAFKRHHPKKEVNNNTQAWLYTYIFDRNLPNNGCGTTIVGIETPEKCLSCGKKENLIQDHDTLDTWFSSGLWTFSTLASLPDQVKIKNGKLFIEGDDFKNFHPTAVLETGYDILFFWVARMIIMTIYAVGDIPFQDVYLHGLIRDEKGRKMSKSLGNVIDPLDMIKKYGTDATRLSLVIGTTPGNDMSLSEEKVAGFRNFANKLWNISRFIMQKSKIKNQNDNLKLKIKNLTLADRWVLEKLEKLIDEISKELDNYNFSQAGEKLREFTWNDLADWYLEASKFEKNGEKDKILIYILENLLKLWHPFMPFVTEVIWQELGKDKMLIIEEWPEKNTPFNKGPASPKRERGEGVGGFNDFELIKNIVSAIRNARSENKVEPSKKIKAIIYAGKQNKLIESQAELIKNLRTGIGELEILDKGKKIGKAIYAAVGEIEIYLIGAIDEEKEKERIKKEIENLEKIIKTTEIKLSNKEFVEKAPEKVVNMEKEKLAKAESELKKLREQIKG